HEQEREFKRFCNPRQKRSQRGRTHNPGNILSVLRLGLVIDRQRGSRQAEHHKREFTGRERTCSKPYAIAKLRHKDFLVSANDLSRIVYVLSELEPERRIENMVKTKWNKSPLDDAEYKGRKRAVLLQHKVGYGVKPPLNRRPNDDHSQA